MDVVFIDVFVDIPFPFLIQSIPVRSLESYPPLRSKGRGTQSTTQKSQSMENTHIRTPSISSLPVVH
jgi:hypothetical protein